MHTNAETARAAFSALIDYAGLFPPAQLALRDALDEYRAARSSADAWVLGRFIVPASRLHDLLEAAAGEPVPLSVIVDAGSDVRSWLPNVQATLGTIAQLRSERAAEVQALEVALPPLRTNRETYDAVIGQYAAAVAHAGFDAVPSYVELPRDARFGELLPGAAYALSRHRLGAKIRCGGLTPQAFPDPDEISAFISAAREEGVPYKATAGLHHPVRHFNQAAGVTMHGFLNILAASAAAVSGADRAELARLLSLEDASQFALDEAGLNAAGMHASAADLEAARRKAFVAYGSCSFTEPIEDLRHLHFI